jgi:hypothetical protein
MSHRSPMPQDQPPPHRQQPHPPQPPPYRPQPYQPQGQSYRPQPYQPQPYQPLPYRPYRPPKTSHRKTIVASIGGFIALLIIGGINSALTSKNGADHHHRAAAPTTAATRTPSPRQPAAHPAATRADKLAHRITAWNHGPGGKYRAKITSRLGAIVTATKARNLPATQRACSRLAATVTAALAAPQIPDPAAAKYYAAALAQFSTSATDCQNAITTADPALLIAAARHMNTGNTDLSEAVTRIDTIAAAISR